MGKNNFHKCFIIVLSRVNSHSNSIVLYFLIHSVFLLFWWEAHILKLIRHSCYTQSILLLQCHSLQYLLVPSLAHQLEVTGIEVLLFLVEYWVRFLLPDNISLVQFSRIIRSKLSKLALSSCAHLLDLIKRAIYHQACFLLSFEVPHQCFCLESRFLGRDII